MQLVEHEIVRGMMRGMGWLARGWHLELVGVRNQQRCLVGLYPGLQAVVGVDGIVG